MNTQNDQSVTITITINPATSGQEIAEQAVHTFFCVLQTALDPKAQHDLGGFSGLNHTGRYDSLLWHATCIAKAYDEEIRHSEKWIVSTDVFLAYSNARPTLIKAGTEVHRQADGTFVTIPNVNSTSSKAHTIPSEAVTRLQ
jgi:GTP cyclohydrolase III